MKAILIGANKARQMMFDTSLHPLLSSLGAFLHSESLLLGIQGKQSQHKMLQVKYSDKGKLFDNSSAF